MYNLAQNLFFQNSISIPDNFDHEINYVFTTLTLDKDRNPDKQNI